MRARVPQAWKNARTRVYYGWYIVAATFLINTFIFGVLAKGLTTFVTPLAHTFGWSYAQISLASSLRGAQAGVTSPFLGRVVDRYPPKWLVLIGIIILAIGYLCLSQVTSLAMLYVSFFIIATGSTLGTSKTPITTVARWFKRDIGKVNGIMAMGIGLGGFAVPVLVKVIDSYGWRWALIFIAIGIIAIGIPLAFVFRTRPEEYGLFPDGRPPEEPKEGRTSVTDFAPTLKEAMKMRAFWQFGFAQLFHWSGVGALGLHVVPYLTSVNIDRAMAAMITMLFLLVSVPARFGFGWTADLFPKKYVTAVSTILMAIGLFIFSFIKAETLWLTIPFIIVYGIGLGGVTPLRAIMIREYFGSKSFGTIFGVTRIFMTITTVLASPLVGLVYDVRGTYYPSWLVLGGVTLLGAIALITMPAPLRPTRSVRT